MQVVVRLAILFASLLLVTNMAFAAPIQCSQELCYDLTYTDNQGQVVWADTMWVCLKDNGIGEVYFYEADCDSGDLYLFGGGPGWFNASGDPAFGGKPNWSQWLTNCGTAFYSLQPIGEGFFMTGVEANEGLRLAINGKKVPMLNCPE